LLGVPTFPLGDAINGPFKSHDTRHREREKHPPSPDAPPAVSARWQHGLGRGTSGR
jgi:hypothetical protein